jgi:hypothetical protein
MLKVLGRTLLAPVLLTLAGLTLGIWRHVTIARYFHPIFNWNVLPVLVALGFARIAQAFLKNFMGDVAVYVNADAKAKNYAARRAILSGATLAITRLLKDDPRSYQRVIVAGHSLESVIAYDVLNELMNRRLATTDQVVGSVPPRAEIHQNDLDKIKGLVTFGSPLDKVVYFFRSTYHRNKPFALRSLRSCTPSENDRRKEITASTNCSHTGPIAWIMFAGSTPGQNKIQSAACCTSIETCSGRISII